MASISKDHINPPSPIRDEQSATFFDGAAEGKLMIKQCPACDIFAPPTDRYCRKCLIELEWTQAKGKGTVFNWTTIHQAAHPGFTKEIPYVIGTIKLEENVRIKAKISGIDPLDMKLGINVEANFIQWPNGEYLPVFVKA